MATKTAGFEGQTNGTTVSAGNSDDFGDAAFSNVSINSQTLRYSSAQAMFGTMSLEVIADATSSTVNFDITDTAAADYSARFYLYLTSYPSVTHAQFPVAWRSSAGALGRLEMSNTGQIRVNMTSNSSYTTATLDLNTWYRIAVFGTGAGTASTNATMRLYAGNSTTLIEEESLTGISTAAQVDRFRWCKIGGSPAASLSAFYDGIEQNVGSGTEIGPVNTLSPGWTSGYSVTIG